jgi:hypothetical protein
MRVVVSPISTKKYRAIFSDGKHTDFGLRGSPDYTLTGDKGRRAAYQQRHKKDLQTKDPRRAGFLSYYLLWGDSTSLEQNIRDYKVMFAGKL